MGIDVKWQAVPEEWLVFKAALTDPGSQELMERLPFIMERGCQPRWASNPEYDREDAANCKLVADLVLAHPGLDTRRYSDDSRVYDSVEWLISAWRRQEDAMWEGYDGLDLGARAIRGSHEIEHSDGLTYSTAEEVVEIACFLEPWTEADLRTNYDPARMEGHVYKFREGDMAWSLTVECFEGMRSVYQAAADHHEAVLVLFW